AALGAGGEVEDALPTEVLDLADAEGGVLVQLVDVVQGDRDATGGERLGRTSAGRPEAARLKKMLKKAANRCQATPMVMLSEMVIIQTNEMTIFRVATAQMAFSSADSEAPEKSSPIQKVKGKWLMEASSPSKAYSRPRRVRMH